MSGENFPPSSAVQIQAPVEPEAQSTTATVACFVIVVLGYLVGFAFPDWAPAVLIALPALCLLARQRSEWRALGLGLMAGFVICAVLLNFMWTIFGAYAVGLWLVGALPFGVFLLLLNRARVRVGPLWSILLTPILWTGLEYFRSEVWPLKFAWLLPGQAAALLPGVQLCVIGVYGLGFVYMLLAALSVGELKWQRLTGAAGLAVAAILMYALPWPTVPSNVPVHVAGVQTERWEVADIAKALDSLATEHPEAQILVLSECAFSDAVPTEVREEITKHQRYLVAGGWAPDGNGGNYNTAFVVGPDGKDIFSQAKSMPVQFLDDGTPAAVREVWESPWGKIGIAICYDACYASVMDDFVRQGARGLIIPTMDLTDWGEFERRTLHGRIQPVRSAEYGIPTFGVWSSGVSQLTDRAGKVIATAGYPGQGETLAGSFDLSRAGRVPPDRYLAWASLIATGLFVGFLLVPQRGKSTSQVS